MGFSVILSSCSRVDDRHIRKLVMKTPLLLLTISFAAVATSFGWDNPGHMTVAGLAYDELTPAQQEKLVNILKQHPDLKPVTDGFPNGALPDGRDLVMAMATWPDLIKSGHPEYKNVGYEEDKPAVTEVRFDHIQHRGWHFIDQPLWVGKEGGQHQLPSVPAVNAVGVIDVLLKQLGGNEQPTQEAYDLGWLEHLVGDLHQPLHAATGVSDVYPKGDTGGNDVVLAGDTHSEPELHAYWDDILGKTARSDKRTHHPRLDMDIVTANHIIAELERLPFGPNSENVTPSVWAQESFDMAKRDVYDVELDEIVSDRGNLQATLNDNYHQTATADGKQQIRLAGHRLALLLKSIL